MGLNGQLFEIRLRVSKQNFLVTQGRPQRQSAMSQQGQLVSFVKPVVAKTRYTYITGVTAIAVFIYFSHSLINTRPPRIVTYTDDLAIWLPMRKASGAKSE